MYLLNKLFDNVLQGRRIWKLVVNYFVMIEDEAVEVDSCAGPRRRCPFGRNFFYKALHQHGTLQDLLHHSTVLLLFPLSWPMNPSLTTEELPGGATWRREEVISQTLLS